MKLFDPLNPLLLGSRVEQGGIPIPYTLTVFSGPTLSPAQPKEHLQNGRNAIKIAGVSYQITEELNRGGMGVVYRAKRHTQSGKDGNPLPEDVFPRRIVVKEMTFDIPEMFVASQETAQAYVTDWRKQYAYARKLFKKAESGVTGRWRGDKVLNELKQNLLAHLPTDAQRQRLKAIFPQYASSVWDIQKSFDTFQMQQLQEDILHQVTDKEYREVLASFLPKNPYSMDQVIGGLYAFANSQKPKVVEIRQDLEKQKLQFLQEAAMLRLLEAKGVKHVPRVVGKNMIEIEDRDRGQATVKNLFIAQTEMPGVRMDAILAGGVAFTEESGVAIAIKLLDTLCAIHAAGLVHRDIKPENILLDTSTQEVSVVDLGIATPHDSKTRDLLRRNHAYAQVSAQGTSGYFAPETLRNVVDPRSDTYAVGRLLFCLLTGQAKLVDSPDDFLIYQLNPNPAISPHLKELIKSATNPEYSNRFTPEELKDQLEMHLQTVRKKGRRGRAA